MNHFIRMSKLKNRITNTNIPMHIIWIELQLSIKEGDEKKSTLLSHALYYGGRNQKSFSYFSTMFRLLRIGFEYVSICNIGLLKNIYNLIKDEKTSSTKKKDETHILNIIDSSYRLSQTNLKLRIPALLILGMYAFFDADILSDIGSYYKTSFKTETIGSFSRTMDESFELIKKGISEKKLGYIILGVGSIQILKKEELDVIFDLLSTTDPEIQTLKEIYTFYVDHKKEEVKNYELNVLYTAILYYYYKDSIPKNMEKTDTLNESKELMKDLESKLENSKYYIQLDEIYTEECLSGKDTLPIEYLLGSQKKNNNDITNQEKFEELKFLCDLGKNCYILFETIFGREFANTMAIERLVRTGDVIDDRIDTDEEADDKKTKKRKRKKV
jgi:hypothetical protein